MIDPDLAFLDAWNAAYGIPSDSLLAQHIRCMARQVERESDGDEWEGVRLSDLSGIAAVAYSEAEAREAAQSLASLAETLAPAESTAKPAIVGLLTVADL